MVAHNAINEALIATEVGTFPFRFLRAGKLAHHMGRVGPAHIHFFSSFSFISSLKRFVHQSLLKELCENNNNVIISKMIWSLYHFGYTLQQLSAHFDPSQILLSS